LIERAAELACDTPWHHIRCALEKLQATDFFSIKHRFIRRNEIAPGTRSMLKKLAIPAPKTILSIEERA
jgi:hypothetical protein